MDDLTFKTIAESLPYLLAGRGWSTEAAEDYIMVSLKVDLDEARKLLQYALDHFPDKMKNVSIIYRALDK